MSKSTSRYVYICLSCGSEIVTLTGYARVSTGDQTLNL
jgi:DNA-directed RNA polymerase subunit RPC12/RpoP